MAGNNFLTLLRAVYLLYAVYRAILLSYKYRTNKLAGANSKDLRVYLRSWFWLS